MKVEKILAEPLEIHKVFSDKKEQHDFLCEMMEEVELQEEQLQVQPPELSGGQRQRVAIARAFAMKPKLLIADEPIASLDVTTQAQMVKLFRHLQREHDCAILFIAHDLSMVRLLCDRVGVMKDGKLVEIGETEQVFEHPQHLYTKKLLEAIPIPEKNRTDLAICFCALTSCVCNVAAGTRGSAGFLLWRTCGENVGGRT